MPEGVVVLWVMDCNSWRSALAVCIVQVPSTTRPHNTPMVSPLQAAVLRALLWEAEAILHQCLVSLDHVSAPSTMPSAAFTLFLEGPPA